MVELKNVMKFGGVCVESGAMIRKSANVVKDYVKAGWSVVAVVSAMAGVTDSLLEALSWAEAGDARFVATFIERLGERHLEALKDSVARPELRAQVEGELKGEVEGLKQLLTAACLLKEVTPRTRDHVLSFGERLSARIFTASLIDLGLKAKYLTGWEAGIVTDDRFGAARPIMSLTYERLQAKLSPLLAEGIVPVVTGFIAATPDGVVTTLGRGGSDYTATIIGAALKVDEVVMWKDVEGIMTADPKLIPEARSIPLMSYEEVMELAYFGAKVVHPMALDPAMKEGIPIRLKSIFKPDGGGTLITKAAAEGVVKAVTMVREAATITVSGASMIEAPTMSLEVLKALDEVGVRPLMMSQGSSQASISLAVPRGTLNKALRSLRRRLAGEDFKVDFEDDVCIITVIGAGMKGRPGVAARVFKAVAERGVNIRMIAQGSSELNISFVVKEADGIKTMRAIHEEFQLNLAT